MSSRSRQSNRPSQVESHVEQLERRQLLSAAAAHGLTGEYFNGDNFQTPTVVRTDAHLSFNWRRFNAPDVLLVGKTFTAQYTGTVTPTVTGTYTFSEPSNSGVRLLINGTTVIDNFTSRTTSTPTGTFAMTAGTAYTIEAQYVSGGAQRDFFALQWSTAGVAKQVIPTADLTPDSTVALPATEALVGTYYTGENFNHEVLTRADPDINFNFPFGEPDPAIPPQPFADHAAFSVVWNGTIIPTYSETYTFQTRTDDGVRLFINGQEIINQYHDENATVHSGTIALTAGQSATVRMEYYANNLRASTASLYWKSASQVRQLVPFVSPAPVAPTNLTATAVSDTEVTLNWTASPGATGYIIDESANGGAFMQITTVGPTPTQYTVGGLTAGTPYSFQVIAIGASGTNSAPSNTADASTEAPLPAFSSLTTIYGLGSDATVYSIDTTNGVQTQIGTLGFNTDSGARSPANGIFYYLSTDPANVQIATWNPASDTNTTLPMSYPISGAVERAAFRSDNTLFFTDGNNTLYTFNVNSQVVTPIGKITSGGASLGGSTGDIAFDPSGNLFIETNNTLFEVTATTLAPAVQSGTASTVINAADIGPTNAQNLQIAFGQNSALYGTDINGSLYIVNTTTGAASPVGTATGVEQGDLASVPAYADLALTQSATTLTAGQNATFTFQVTNAGPQATPGPTTITDVLPTGLTFVSGTGSGWTFNVSGSTVTAIYTGIITSGGNVPPVSITVAVGTSAPSSITNTAVVASSIFDTNVSNNTSTLVSTVTA